MSEHRTSYTVFRKRHPVCLWEEAPSYGWLPTIPVPAEDLRDPIEIRVDIVHLEPVVAVAFPAAGRGETQAQHK
ncbi:hypothetical protein Tco_1058289 [Tanacetum coccineum]|uniref:Uncharacterized protein n=1 Tax=Tanacetum coccineum TaxID=301880 RepID=A0ABQ5H9N5_9ASTR